MIVGWSTPKIGLIVLYQSEARYVYLGSRRTNRLLITNQRLHARSHARLHRETWRIRGHRLGTQGRV